MSLDGGSVYVTLGAVVEEAGFVKYDALVAKAKGTPARGVKRTLSIDYDDKAFKAFEADMKKAGALRDRKVTLKLDADDGGSTKRLGRDLKDTDRNLSSFERRLLSGGRGARAFGGALATASGAVGRLSVSFGPISGKIGNIVNSLTALSPVILAVVGVMGALTASFGSATLGAGALATALGGVLFANLPLGIGVFSRFAKVLEAVKDKEKAAEDRAVKLAQAHDEAAASTEARHDAQRAMNQAMDGADKAERAYKQAVAETRKEIADSAAVVKDARRDVVDAERDVREAREATRRELRDAVAAETAAAREMVTANHAVTEARREAGRAAEDANRAVRNSTLDVRGAELNVESAGFGVEDARRAVEEATDPQMRERAINALRKAENDYRRAVEDLAQAKRDAADAQKRQNEFEEKGLLAYKPLTDAIEAQRQALVTLKQAAADLNAKRAEQLRGTDSERQAARRLQDARERLRDVTADYAELQEQGIKRNPRVVAAAEALKAANDAVAESIHNIARARMLTTPTSTFRTGVREEKLSDAEIELRDAIGRIKDTFQQALGPAVDEVFEGIADFLDGITPLLNDFSGEWQDVGEAIGDVFRMFAQEFNNPEWRDFFEQTLGASPGIVHELGDMFITLLEILRDVSSSALPDLVDLLKDANDWLDKLSENASPEEMRGTVHELVGSFRDWIKLIGAAAELLNAFFGAGREEGDGLVETITDLFNKWADFLETKEGQEAMRDFLHDSVAFAKDLAEFIVPVAEGIGIVGRTVISLADKVGGTDVLGKIFGVFLVARFVGITKVVSKMLGLLLEVGKSSGAIAKVFSAVGMGGLAGAGAGAAGAAGGAAGGVEAAAVAGAAGGAAGGAGKPGRGVVRRLVGKLPLLGAVIVGVEMLGGDQAGFFSGKGGLHSGLISDEFQSRIDALKRYDAAIKQLREGGADSAIRTLRDHMDQLTKKTGELEASGVPSLNRFIDEATNAGKAETAFDKVQKAIARLRKRGGDDIEEIKSDVRTNMILIRRSLDTESAKGKDALNRNFHAAVLAIGIKMKDAAHATSDGARAVRGLLRQALALYGIKGKEATRYIEGRDTKTGKTDPSSASGNVGAGAATGGVAGEHFATGRSGWGPRVNGWIGKQGQRGKDAVRAVLGKGEAVLNAAQQRIVNAGLSKLGVKGLPDLFRRTKGSRHHYAEGGVVDGYDMGGYVQQAAANGGGAHLQPVARDFARWAFRKGWSVTSAFRPGDPHQHGAGMALDFGDSVNDVGEIWRTLFPQRAQFNQLLGPPGLYNGADRFYNPDLQADHMDHVHVGFAGMVKKLFSSVVKKLKVGRVVGGGASGALANLAVKTLGRAAQDRLEQAVASTSQMEAGIEGGAHVNFRGNKIANEQLAKRMASARGWVGNQWNALRALWTGESHFDEHADNPGSDAYGIPQALPGEKMAASGPDWHDNPATQIDWGLDYIDHGSANFHDPVSAYRFWLSHNPHWYGEGGVVEMSRGGGGIPHPNLSHGVGETSAYIKSMLSSLPNMAGLSKKIATGEDYYTALDRKYDSSVEDLVIEGDETHPAVPNEPAIRARVGELDSLIRKREQITRWLDLQVKRLQRYIEVLTGIVESLKRALKGTHGRKARRGYKKLIAKYSGQLETAQIDLLNAEAAAGESRTDTQTLKDERTGLLEGTTVGALISGLDPGQGGPAFAEPPSGLGPETDTGTDPDLQAQLDQANQAAADAQADLAASQANFNVFKGPGDLGTGLGKTAFWSVARDARTETGAGTGVFGTAPPGPQHRAAFDQPMPGTGHTVNVYPSSLLPGDVPSQRAIAGAVTVALDHVLTGSNRRETAA